MPTRAEYHFLFLSQQITIHLAAQKHCKFIISQYCRTKPALTWLIPLPCFVEPNSRYQLAWAFIWRLWWEIYCLAVVGLRSPFPCSLSSGSLSCKFTCIPYQLTPPSSNQQQHVETLSHLGSLWLPLLRHLSYGIELEKVLCF